MIQDDVCWDFFLAHAQADRQTAASLYDLLSSLDDRCRIFLDFRSLRLGDDWDIAIAAAQRRALITVILVSTDTETAYYQREEVAAAIALAREAPDNYRVVPIYMGACPPQTPYGLRLKHGLTLGADCSLSDAAARLLDLRRSLSQKESPSNVGAFGKAEAKPITESAHLAREHALCVKADAEFRRLLRSDRTSPLPDEFLQQAKRNVEREYAPFSVFQRSLELRLELLALPIVRKRIALEAAMRRKHNLSFSESRIGEIRQQIREYISEESKYYVQAAHGDALDHVERTTGYIFDYKRQELDRLREEYLTREPEELYRLVDDELQIAFAESLLSRGQ